MILIQRKVKYRRNSGCGLQRSKALKWDMRLRGKKGEETRASVVTTPSLRFIFLLKILRVLRAKE